MIYKTNHPKSFSHRLFAGLLALLFLGLGNFAAAQGDGVPEVRQTSPEEQQKVYKELAEKTYFAHQETDEQGNIIYVCFNQMGPFKKNNPDAPGLTGEDLAQFTRFPKLEGFTLQGQPLRPEDYAVLRAFPDLKVAGLKNLATNDKLADDLDYAPALRYLKDMKNLLVLDLTHSFGLQDNEPVLNELEFPELETLIVDVGYADDFDELMPLIAKSPKITRLKLHRTPFSDEQMKQILDALPNLVWLEMKPRGNTPGKNWSHQSLAMIPQYPNIQYLRLIHGDALPLPWENGLEHLANAENLKLLQFPNAKDPEKEVKEEDLQKLREALPNLQINPARDAEVWDERPNPVDYKWDYGPN
jgi:hypothetical protein